MPNHRMMPQGRRMPSRMILQSHRMLPSHRIPRISRTEDRTGKTKSQAVRIRNAKKTKQEKQNQRNKEEAEVSDYIRDLTDNYSTCTFSPHCFDLHCQSTHGFMLTYISTPGQQFLIMPQASVSSQFGSALLHIGVQLQMQLATTAQSISFGKSVGRG